MRGHSGNIITAKDNPSGRSADKPGYCFKRSAFTCAVTAQKGDDLPVPDLKTYAFERRYLSIICLKVLNPEKRLATVSYSDHLTYPAG